MNLCQWIRPGGDLCKKQTNMGGQFCPTHQTLVSAGYVRPERPDEFALDREKDERARWKAELDDDFAAGKTRRVKRDDFPRVINGIEFDSIEQYYELYGTPKKKSQQKPLFERGRFDRVDDPYFHGGSITDKPSRFPDHLQRGYYQLCETVAHMRYIVYRDMAGQYYAVFVSLFKGGTVEQVMAVVATTELPSFMPLDVPGVGSFHTHHPRKSMRIAENQFYTSHESISRMKERMRKAADPKWIPPNLRTMAIETTYDAAVWKVIPAEEHPRLKQWLDRDCPGWYGKAPNGGYRYRTIKGEKVTLENVIPITATSSDAPQDMIWDEKLKRYIKKP